VLTAYSDSALKSELTADPAGLGYAARLAAHDLDGAAALLNGATATAYGPVPTAEVLLWGAQAGVRAAIQTAATSGTSQSIALAVLDLLQGGYSYLDTTDARIVGAVGTGPYTPGAGAVTTPGLLDELVAAGVMTDSQKDALISLGKATVGRPAALWTSPPPIDAARIAAALRS